MKKFHFYINNFSGIFGSMSGEGKNIDTFLNEKIAGSLSAFPSQGFEEVLLKRISLENEFRRQDVKTDKIARSFMIAGILIFIMFIGLAGFVLKNNQAAAEGPVSGTIDSFANIIENASLQLTSIFGLSLGSQSGAILLVMLLSVLLFTIAEKFLFRRNAGKQPQN
jgi:hypothetical protein